MFEKDAKLVDLTHTITTSIPAWQGTASFSVNIIKDYHQGHRTQHFSISSNAGTHMDAPSHFQEYGETIDDISLAQLVVSAIVLNVSEKSDETYRISVDDITEFEEHHGIIPENSLAIANTGWYKRWKEPQKYRNLDAQNIMQFPGFTVEAIQMLIDRNIAGLAIDTLSPDGNDAAFPGHKLLLNANKYIIENITNLDALPPIGTTVIALPLKIQDAVEAPMRIIGIVPPKK
jgi:kynurenine formamidase